LDTQSEPFASRYRDHAVAQLGRYRVKEGMDALSNLNAMADSVFPRLSSTPLPVMLPVDTPAFTAKALRSDVNSASPAPLANSIRSMTFLPGLSGYDAIITLSDAALRGLNVSSAEAVQIHIGGVGVSYSDSNYGELVTDLQDRFPELRRTLGAAEL